MHSLEIFCDEIGQRVEATRRYRHDLKGYIQMLEALLETDGQNEVIRRYVEEQREKQLELKNSDEFIYTIIHVKQEECERKGIPFQFCIADGDYSGMEGMDKVCLLVNLLDNAIEATERLKQGSFPEIRLELKIDDDKIKIYLENALVENEEFSFLTKKSDKANHGLGTKIIQQVLDKYDGVRHTVADKEHQILKDELSLTLKRGEAATCRE